MPTKPLPPSPNLAHLKNQAKDLQRAIAVRDPRAAQRVREFHWRFKSLPDALIFSKEFSLSDAQQVIAREYRFPRWSKFTDYLRQPEDRSLPHHERIGDPVFRQAVALLDKGEAPALKELLHRNPELVHQRVFFDAGSYFGTPSLLQFIAENPVRHRTLPPNILEIATLILEAGAKSEKEEIDRTLTLVASGCVPRERGVQIELINLLCDYGANPDTPMAAALTQGEFGAVEALLGRGAQLDLPVAASTGRLDATVSLLEGASDEGKALALAFAAQYGHLQIVRMLLKVGVDPTRYNPIGAHSHSTPLHQAACYGHLEVVKLLVKHGANLSAKDTIYDGTPKDWAIQGGKNAVVDYLEGITLQ